MHERYSNRQLYFNEMRQTTTKHVIPWIAKSMNLNGARVLEMGSGEGGNLPPFLDLDCEVVGVDKNTARISQASKLIRDVSRNEKLVLINEDVMKLSPTQTGKFDLIVLKDFIEHIDQEAFIPHMKQFLNTTGKIFIGFPPWQMPFGGHQQVCTNRFSRIPWIHLLPAPLYLGYLKLMGEPEDSRNDLAEIIQYGISIEKLRKFLVSTGLKVEREQQYFINPGYESKFNLRPRKQLALLAGIPFLRNFATTCCYMLVSKS